jgi:hypothetical protein
VSETTIDTIKKLLTEVDRVAPEKWELSKGQMNDYIQLETHDALICDLQDIGAGHLAIGELIVSLRNYVPDILATLDFMTERATKAEADLEQFEATLADNEKYCAELSVKLAEAEKAHRWISVEERLPEQVGFYLVAFGGEHPFVRDRYFDEKFGFDSRYVTHWTQMPQPPEVPK